MAEFHENTMVPCGELMKHGLYYLYSEDKERPCWVPLNKAATQTGVLCFATATAAKGWAKKANRCCGRKNFSVRHVPLPEVMTWAEQMRRYGEWLVFSRSDGYMGLKIEVLLRELPRAFDEAARQAGFHDLADCCWTEGVKHRRLELFPILERCFNAVMAEPVCTGCVSRVAGAFFIVYKAEQKYFILVLAEGELSRYAKDMPSEALATCQKMLAEQPPRPEDCLPVEGEQTFRLIFGTQQRLGRRIDPSQN